MHARKKRKRIVRYILRLLLVLVAFVLVFCLIYRKEVSYGLAQLKGQLSILNNTIPLEEVMQNDSLNGRFSDKLKFVDQVLKYAEDSLGLSVGDAYQTFYDQKGRPVLWVITACPPFDIKPVKWTFPIAGSFPYKGFFDKTKADKEYQQLIDKGFDVDMGEVNAWSTLGYMNDPLMSSLLESSRIRIARTMIHEVTHRTVFVRGDVTYNENLASFVGDIGALKYFESTYGKESDEYLGLKYRIDDADRYIQKILEGTNVLKEFYASSSFQALDSLSKRAAKEGKIKDVLTEIRTVEVHNRENYLLLRDTTYLPNNAWFADYITYRSDQEKLQEDFAPFKGDVKKYIKYLEEKYPVLNR